MTVAIALIVLLWFGIATIWVPGRWSIGILEAGAFLLSAAVLPGTLTRKSWRQQWPFWLPVAIVGWGCLQIATRWTLAAAETEWAALYWLAAACFAGLGLAVRDRDRFLDLALWSGATMSVLALAQLYTSKGKLLWLFPTNHEVIYGTFPYYNNYAAFIELLFPLALCKIFQTGKRWWIYAVIAAVMYGSVIATTSRAGALLLTLELLAGAILAMRLTRLRQLSAPLRSRFGGLAVRLGFVFIAIAGFALVGGYHGLWQRLWHADPYGVRREYLDAALSMIAANPLRGSGLGTWTSAYPEYAVADFGVVANHAHSEWAQWAVEGGLGVPVLMAAVLGAIGKRTAKTIWGIGLVAVLLHAVVDYPMVRMGLGCWWFAMFGVFWAYQR